MRSLDEYRKAHPKQVPDRRPDLKLMVQAEVEAGALMADKHWSLYQSYLQEAINRLSQRASDLLGELKEPSMTNMDRVMWLKAEMHGFEQQVAALEWALKLPKDIVANGKQAKTLINNA